MSDFLTLTFNRRKMNKASRKEGLAQEFYSQPKTFLEEMLEDRLTNDKQLLEKTVVKGLVVSSEFIFFLQEFNLNWHFAQSSKHFRGSVFFLIAKVKYYSNCGNSGNNDDSYHAWSDWHVTGNWDKCLCQLGSDREAVAQCLKS